MPEFDVHEHRHALKQLRDAGDTSLWENRKAVACPACGEPFDRLFTTRQSATRFPENDGARFCLVREADAIHVFRH
ncbi:flagella cluster protein [Halorubrum rubrum]|uniref:Flagella cluster protein n=1 Tax=Halorubrum rubrum TaxID=1126240 RepID=A0ABD5R2F0_9EURY|nr:flagella cluster protein [Halorubrum rubrum]